MEDRARCLADRGMSREVSRQCGGLWRLEIGRGRVVSGQAGRHAVIQEEDHIYNRETHTYAPLDGERQLGEDKKETKKPSITAKR